MAEFDRTRDILELEAFLGFPSNNDKRLGMRELGSQTPECTGPALGTIKYDSSGIAYYYNADGECVGPWPLK